MKLYLIRHGRQCDSRCNVDVGLAREGVRQAELVGQRLRNICLGALYSSNLIRARETARHINSYIRLEHRIEPDLAELDFGDMQGLTDSEVEERYADFQARQATYEFDLRYPGGENAADLVARVIPALRCICRAHSGEDVAVVTHGVVIRAVLCHIMHAPLARWRTVGNRLENGSITVIVYDEERDLFTLEVFNDHAHLDPYPELLRSAWGVNEN